MRTNTTTSKRSTSAHRQTLDRFLTNLSAETAGKLLTLTAMYSAAEKNDSFFQWLTSADGAPIRETLGELLAGCATALTTLPMRRAA